MEKTKASVSKLNKSKTEFKKLNNRNVQAFKPRAWDYHVRDTELKGYYLKITTQGAKTYGVESKLGTSRKTIKRAFGSSNLYSEPEARTKATEWLQLIKEGIDPKQHIEKRTEETLNNPTLEYVHQLYVESRTLRPKTIRDYLNVWKQPYIAELGRKPIKELTVEDIVTWFNRNKEKKPRQTQKAFTMIGVAYKYAVPLDIIETNIFESRVKALVEQVTYEPKNTYLSLDKELPAFVQAISELSHGDEYFNSTARDWILFCLMYGLRTTECSLIEWSMIDMNDKTFTLPKEITKTDQDLKLPLTDLSTVMLMSRSNSKKKNKKYVFQNVDNSGHVVNAGKTMDKIKNHVRHALKDEDFTTSFHDFRATFENLLISMEVPLDERQRLMNHSRKKNSQQVYARETFEVQRNILNEYNRELQKDMQYLGELFALYAWDEGMPTDDIISNFTSIQDDPNPPTKTIKQTKKPKELDLDAMLKKGLGRNS